MADDAKRNETKQSELVATSQSTSATAKQAKKRTRTTHGGVVVDEEPYAPQTRYSLGTNKYGGTSYIKRNKVPLLFISLAAGMILLYMLIFFIDSKYDDDDRSVVGEAIKFNLPTHAAPERKPDGNVALKPILRNVLPTLRTIEDYAQSFKDDSNERRTRVREAMKHAYSNYVKFAWGRDELKPISKNVHNWVPNGMGMTTLDSLDTLFIMGLKEEFDRATQFVDKEMPAFDSIDTTVSVFETTIRVLGGLLAAYDLSQDKIYMEKARSIGDRLMPAFTSVSGIPYAQVQLKRGEKNNFSWNGGCSVLSEFGTLQLEFRRLSEVTGDPKYDKAVTRVMDVMEKQSRAFGRPGLYPVNFHPDQQSWCGDHITLGAYGDSFYEYLLKQWIMSNGRQERYRVLYEESAKGIIDHILVKPPKHWYISEMRGGSRVNKIDHLVCFAAGMFALGHATNATKGLSGEKYDTLEVAKQFTKTCYDSYTMTATGLGPETFMVDDGSGDIRSGVASYLLRPETVESIFIMYRVTGDDMYRDWGWKIFEAMEKNCRVENGYSGVNNVNIMPPQYDDFQQSFFLAETLKYLYLLFSPTNVIPLDQWVFNTEAHPFRITK